MILAEIWRFDSALIEVLLIHVQTSSTAQDGVAVADEQTEAIALPVGMGT